MRNILTALLVLALLVPSVDARRSKDKAGKVSDGIYTDKKYGFELKMVEEWKYSVKENDDNFRLTLTQSSFETPPQYLEAPDYTRIPTISVYADTTSMSVTTFFDSLLSETYKSDQKKQLYKEFEIINEQSSGGLTRQDLMQTGRRSLDVGGEHGIFWTGKVKYRNEILTGKMVWSAAQRTTIEETKRVYGGLAGCIVAVKNGDHIVLLHMICEEDYFDPVLSQTMKVIESLKFAQSESQKTD